MIRTLFVGNLPRDLTPERLTDLVASHIEVVETRFVLDRETGRCRGFAFVDVVDCRHLRRAISILNGCLLEGQELRVAEARSQRQDAQQQASA